MAYPVLIPVSEHRFLIGLSRESLIGLAPSAQGAFERVPLQVDEMEDGRLLVLRSPAESMPVRERLDKPAAKDPFKGETSRYHRLAMNESTFGSCDAACARDAVARSRTACGADSAPQVFRVDAKARGKTAFIVDCGRKMPAFEGRGATLDTSVRTLTTPSYELRYSKKSPVLLEALEIKGQGTILSDSFFQVRVNPRYFFSVKFDETNLSPEITAVQPGPVGTSAELALGLRTMGFRTNFQICCDLTAYSDAFYLPVVIDLPFKGSALKHVSGVVYGFKFTGDPKADVTSTTRAFAQLGNEDAKAAKDTDTANGADASAPGASSQNGNTLLLRAKEAMVSIGVRPKVGGAPVVAVLGPDDLKKLGFKETDVNLGFFVDLTKMKDSGLHHFDIWFYAGKAADRGLLQEYAAKGVEYAIGPVN